MSKVFRFEVIGTWDVSGEDQDEALEYLTSVLPDNVVCSQSDVVVKLVSEEEVPKE